MPSFRRLSTVPERTADDLHTCPKITMAAHFHTVTFLPENKRIRVAHLKTIFETIGEENTEHIQLFFSCGAEGICQKCKVRSLQSMGPLTATEKGCLSEAELSRGIRLACQARVVQDSQVEIQYKRPFTIMLTDEDIGVQGPERLRKIVVEACEGRPLDAETLLPAAVRAGVEASLETLNAQLSACVMNRGIQGQALWTAAFFDGRLIALEPGDTSTKLYAAAVDLGTNTLEVSLIDAARGRKIAVVTDSNPQIELGDTYEARLAMVEDDALNLEILNEEIILRIDLLLYELCVACDVSPLHVYEILLAGATGMLHLFLMRAPGPLEQRVDGRLTAGQLELRSTAQAGISLLPAIGLYAGADITAAILATRLHRSDTTTLLLDLGGSSKAVLYHNGRLLASVAGRTTVFDAAGLSCGMRPEAGAVTGVRLGEHGDCEVDIIGESLPRGVSASGLLELAACLRRAGTLDYFGNFIHTADDGQTPLARRLTVLGDEPAFVLYSDPGEFATDIYVTRRDMFRLREARARVAALFEHVCARAGTAPGDIRRVLVSGTLGGAPSGSTLAALGFLPVELTERTVFIGNASKHGAQLALLDIAVADEAEELARTVEYIPYPDHDPPEAALHF